MNLSKVCTMCFLIKTVRVIDGFSQIARKYMSSTPNQIRTKDATGSFLQEVSSWLLSSNINFHAQSIQQSPFQIIGLGKDSDCGSCKVGLHIIPTTPKTTSKIPPNLYKLLTDDKSLPFDTIIHLHQDVWNNKKEIVQARISAKVNRVQKSWYARKTTIKRINKLTAMEFLEKHHLWGATKGKFNYGLYEKDSDELIAVATFSPRRHVQRGNDTIEGGVDGIGLPSRPYRSHELIRYCSKRDGRVVGGITKLIAGFCRDLAPDDLVTCIDRDWGDGGGWESIQFEKVSVMPPLLMAVGEDGIRRYLVGAGIGQSNKSSSNDGESDKNDRNGRPGISLELYNDLNQIEDNEEAMECITSHNLHPVYDAGIERRMLLISKSKLKAQTCIRQEELELEEISLADHVTANDLWSISTPSFPSEYYSENKGINSLLQNARESDDPKFTKAI